MKNQLVALADANFAAAQALRDAIYALPEDPIPAPTGFRISRTYGGTDSPVSAEFAWQVTGGTLAVLEYKGAPGNPNGPGDWTDVQVNASPGPNGELATFTVSQQGTQQTILFRLRATFNGAYSEPVTLQFSTPENLPEALT